MSGAADLDAKLAELDDWRGAKLARLRGLIHAALPDVVEEIKWRKPTNPSGVPTWNHGGLLCTGETYKDKVKLTFMKGRDIDDPTGIFTGGFGGTRRVIDLHEGDDVDDDAFQRLMQRAAALNEA